MYQAFQELFEEKEVPQLQLVYSGKFKPYNAHVQYMRYGKQKLVFNLSNTWKHIDEEIQKGLIQYLLLKVYREKKHTYNIDLYHFFIKNLDKSTTKNNKDAFLEEQFHLINEQYFDSMLDICNLTWGKRSKRTLGTYDFHTDTIRISTLLKEAPLPLLHYILYHEMCHKWTKFESKYGRTRSHTSAFRKKEREFKNFTQIEKDLNAFLRTCR